MYLICILLLALFLRIYNIAGNPPSLSWDEVSIGYNAYSILKTGRDEHGKFLPMDAFASYGDYKPPLAVYLTVPSVALFGLNELSVRLPSAVFGTLTVLLTYMLVMTLLGTGHVFSDKKIRVFGNDFIVKTALYASLVLSVSPWHVNISRAGFEANIAVFFVVLGVWLVLTARFHPQRWLIAWLPFVAGVYTFNSTRYFVPFMALGLLVYCKRTVYVQRKQFVVGVIIGIISLLPLVPHLQSKEARLRFAEVNIFTDSSIVRTANDRNEYDKHSLISFVFDNRRIGYVRSFFSHYLDHFTADFLFIKGDGNPKFSTQDVGQMYIMDIPFLLVGLYVLFTYFRPEAWLILYWLITAIIPAATARETPHALRILNSLPTWQICISIGLVAVWVFLRKQKSVYVYGFIVFLLYSGNIAYYLHNYYVHYPRLYSGEWQYGYKQALSYVMQHGTTYKKIYLSESIGRAYMYTLFYTQYDPIQFQERNTSYFDAAGFYHVDGFDRYIFSQSVPDGIEADSLYIFPPGQVPENATVKDRIVLLNGEPVLTAFEK